MKVKFEKEVVVTLISIIIICSVGLINAYMNETVEVITVANISNMAPFFFGPIPNWSWPINLNLTNAFDLDDYFLDDSGYEPNYSSSNATNVTIFIDSENRVSFYPDYNFFGVNTVVFYADDGEYNTSSNVVYLFVGTDTEPPHWFNPIRSKVRVYQNDIVNFTTLWTDNLQLQDYYFTIDGYTSSWIGFSGTQNTSTYSYLVSAGAGSTLTWAFCARDTSDNMNCTDGQVFEVSSIPEPPEPPEPPPGGGGGGGGGEEGGLTGYVAGEPPAEIARKVRRFSVDPEYFKISLKQGSTETRLLTITNLGNLDLLFNLSVELVEDFITLSEDSFTVLFGGSKKITVDFTAHENATPEEYFGRIIVNSSEIVEIPVVIDVNAIELAFDVDVDILEEFKRVRPGNPVKANITINNLKDLEPTNLNLYIAIKDLYGNIYDSSQEEIPFSSTVSFERDLNLPADVREGEYLFYARVYDEESVAIDSDIFLVGIRFNFAVFLKSSFIFLLIAFLSVFAIVLILKYRRERDKERVLSLYLMVNELKNLINEGKFDNAVNLYVRIKAAYGEPVSKSALDNKEKLKEEVRKLSKKLKQEVQAIKSESKKSDEKKDVKKSSTKSLAKPAAKPANKPAAKPAAKPAVKPVAKPANKPVDKPANKPAAKPVAKPAAKPVNKPDVKPNNKQVQS